ncbi:MAG: response regulator transcription factor [Gammaproteobacteria bacterium]|nr:response regulator transcription factor [Gammaproteobacteria bacterium]
MTTRVVIADDHPLFRAALRHAVASVLPDAAIEEAPDVAGLRQLAAARPDPDLVLLDLMMPDGRSFAPLAWLRSQLPGTAVLIVSATDDPAVIRQAQAFGAAGYVPKSSPPEDLVAAIRTVVDCGEWFPRSAGPGPRRAPDRKQELAARLASLTPQQFRVMELLAAGRLNKQIAGDLGIEETTVKAHVSAGLAKLGVRNRTQASLVFNDLEISDTDQLGLEG